MGDINSQEEVTSLTRGGSRDLPVTISTRDYDVEGGENEGTTMWDKVKGFNWSLVFLLGFTTVIFLVFFLFMFLPYRSNHNIYLINYNTTSTSLVAVIKHVKYSTLEEEYVLASYSLNVQEASNYAFSLYTRDNDLDYDVLYTIWTSTATSVIVKTDLNKNESTVMSTCPFVILAVFRSGSELYAIGGPGNNNGLYNITAPGTPPILHSIDSSFTIVVGGGKGANPISYYFRYTNPNGTEFIGLIDAAPNVTQHVQTKFSLDVFRKQNQTVHTFAYYNNADEFVVQTQELYNDRRIRIVLMDASGNIKETQCIPDKPAQPYESWVQTQKGIGGEYVVCVKRSWTWVFTGVTCYRYELNRNTLAPITSDPNIPNGRLLYIGA